MQLWRQQKSSNIYPKSILHGMYVKDIPVKSFQTLFCPVYVLGANLNSAGGAGPSKWEPCSRIGVYLSHLPFHAGSVELAWNTTTGRAIPQYNVVFNNDFTTIQYMEVGTVPPNEVDLVTNLSEKLHSTTSIWKTLGCMFYPERQPQIRFHIRQLLCLINTNSTSNNPKGPLTGSQFSHQFPREKYHNHLTSKSKGAKLHLTQL